jgi:hypothetical protein
MDKQPHSSPEPEQASSPELAGQVGRTQHYLRVLAEMVDIGADLLRMVQQEALQVEAARLAAAKSNHDPLTTPAMQSVADYAEAYNLISRSIRRTMLLDEKLAEPKQAPASSASANRTAARKRIIRDVEDVIQRKAGDDDHEQALHAELLDRLDSPDLDDEIANRTIPEIVNDICRDFGIAALPGAHPWKRRIPHDIAILCARADQLAGAAPSAALTALLAAAPKQPPRRVTPVSGSDPPMDPAEEVAMIMQAVERERWESGQLF